MRYIRFLKTPKIQDNSVKTTITVTSDLGETFLNAEIDLIATLQCVDDPYQTHLRQTLRWRPGLRALPVTFPIVGKIIKWPCSVHVSLVQPSDYDAFENREDASSLPSVVSVWSDGLDPPNRIATTPRIAERRFKLLNGRVLRMWEETGESIARHLWFVFASSRLSVLTLITNRDGGIALTAYVDRMITSQIDQRLLHEESVGSPPAKRLNIIELGCGCGMVGISLAQSLSDCQVLLTDMPEAEEIACQNLAIMDPLSSSRAAFVTLDWEEPLPKVVAEQEFDLVVVSECTYNTDTIPALVQTLSALARRSPNAIVLLSTKVRHSSESIFFDLMQKTNLLKVGHTELPLPKDASSDDDPEVIHVYIFQGKEAVNSILSRRDGKPRIDFLPPQ